MHSQPFINVVAYGLGTVTVFDSNETAPVCVNNLPSTTAPVFAEMDIAAMIFPLKIDVVPRVAELPTCQKILAALAPPARTTCVPAIVVSVDPIWKIHVAFGSPWASRVTFPADNITELEFLYRPGASVSPLRSPGKEIAFNVRPAASLYAAVSASLAAAAAGFARSVDPVTVGAPVSVPVGLVPRLPLIMVGPLFVTPAPARIAYGAAAPSATVAGPNDAAVEKVHTKLLASALPAKSLAPVVIVAVNVVPDARLLTGVKVKILFTAS